MAGPHQENCKALQREDAPPPGIIGHSCIPVSAACPYLSHAPSSSLVAGSPVTGPVPLAVTTRQTPMPGWRPEE